MSFCKTLFLGEHFVLLPGYLKEALLQALSSQDFLFPVNPPPPSQALSPAGASGMALPPLWALTGVT